MDRTKPKRLWNVQTMKVEMYKDIQADVENNGYVCVSHVWGDQKMFTADKLGIKGGVDWKIPLSDSGKIDKLVYAMKCYKKEYCWFDVLCMPQDKQDEINLEIPLMGDYYSGADIVFALSTVELVISETFNRWCELMKEVVGGYGYDRATAARSAEGWRVNLLDISKEKWLTRLWTYQEAIMAKKLILVCTYEFIDLYEIASYIKCITDQGIPAEYLFSASGHDILEMLYNRNTYCNKDHDLVKIMDKCSRRDCFKPQDKFYGAFGVLGYKDFPINYDISIDDLNMKIVQYAYSKGDISWLAVGGDEGSGFVQPLYKPFPSVGYNWKEDIPGICGIRLEEKIVRINVWSFARVVRCKKITKDDDTKFLAYMYTTFKNWGLNSKDIVRCMVDYEVMLSDEAEIVEALLERIIGNKIDSDFFSVTIGDTIRERNIRSSKLKIKIGENIKELTLVEAITWENKKIPLRVSGNAKIGDRIMLARITDTYKRSLGIVVNKHSRRKGICLYKKIGMNDEELASRYISHVFQVSRLPSTSYWSRIFRTMDNPPQNTHQINSYDAPTNMYRVTNTLGHMNIMKEL